jgi:hypothetical protein
VEGGAPALVAALGVRPCFQEQLEHAQAMRLAAVVARVGREVQGRLLPEVRLLSVLAHRHRNAVDGGAGPDQHSDGFRMAVDLRRSAGTVRQNWHGR